MNNKKLMKLAKLIMDEYAVFDMPKSIQKNLIDESIKYVRENCKDDNYELIFKNHLKKSIDTYLRPYLKDNKYKAKVILKFINQLNFKGDNPNKVIAKLINFINDYNLNVSLDIYEEIFNNSSLFCSYLDNLMIMTKDGKLDYNIIQKIYSEDLVQLLISYCVYKDIALDYDYQVKHNHNRTQYIDEISDIPLLTYEEEREILKRVKNGDQEAKNKIVTHNLRLVHSVVRQYKSMKLDKDDLMQEGSLGLIKAAEKFDLSKETRFSTYAVWWIRQAITRALTDFDRTIRVPTYENEIINKIDKFITKYNQQHGTNPSLDEISSETGYSIRVIKSALQIKDAISYNEPVKSDESETELKDFIPSRDMSLEDKIIGDSLKEKIEEMITESSLKNQEKEIIIRLFGLFGREEEKAATIAKSLKITRQRVNQITDNALEKLEHFKKARDLAVYIDYDPREEAKKQEIISFYDNFSGYDKGEIDYIIENNLHKREKYGLSKILREDYTYSPANLNGKEREIINKIITSIKNLLKNPKDTRNKEILLRDNRKSLYEELKSYTKTNDPKKEIDEIVKPVLRDKDWELITYINGTDDFLKVCKSHKVTAVIYNDYRSLITRMRKILTDYYDNIFKMNNMTTYELLKLYTKTSNYEQEIDDIILPLMDEKEWTVLEKRSGNRSFNSTGLDNLDLDTLLDYSNLIKNLQFILIRINKTGNRNKIGKNKRTIYELLPDFSKEEIDSIIKNILSKEEIEILNKRSGGNDYSLINSEPLSAKETAKFSNIVAKIRRCAMKERERKETVARFMEESTFIELSKYMDGRDALIVMLKLGLNKNNEKYTNIDIATLLYINRDEMILIIANALEKFKNEIYTILSTSTIDGLEDIKELKLNK